MGSSAGAAIGGVTSIAGGFIQSNAAQNAATTQQNANQQAQNTLWDMYKSNINLNQPFYNSATTNLAALNSAMPDLTTPFSAQQYQQSPGYQWQLQQGQNALQASAASRGMLNSTGTQQALLGYSQGLANQDYQQAYQNYMNQQSQRYSMYAGLANGSNINSLMSMGNQTAQGVAGLYQNTGQAQAAGILGQANATAGAMNGFSNSMSSMIPTLFGGGGNRGGGGGGNPMAGAYSMYGDNGGYAGADTGGGGGGGMMSGIGSLLALV